MVNKYKNQVKFDDYILKLIITGILPQQHNNKSWSDLLKIVSLNKTVSFNTLNSF